MPSLTRRTKTWLLFGSTGIFLLIGVAMLWVPRLWFWMPPPRFPQVHREMVRFADEKALRGSQALADSKNSYALLSFSLAIISLPFDPLTEARRDAYLAQWKKCL